MIIFNSNLINDTNPGFLTIIHDFSPQSGRAACSIQDAKFLENYLGHPIDFVPYPSYNKVHYYTPNEDDENRLKTLSTFLVIREVVKPLSKKEKLIFKKV